MLAHVVDAALASRARPVIVVTGHQHQDIAAALAGRDVRLVHAPDHASGQSASLRAGLRALPPEAAAALVCLGDMPLVPAALLDQLIAAWDPDEGRTLVRPVHDGAAGNPVLWDRRYFNDIAALSGDQGARALLRDHADQITEIETASDAVLRDFDTPQTLADLTG
jgi:molybdenum cofactor cytidylyltransferase